MYMHKLMQSVSLLALLAQPMVGIGRISRNSNKNLVLVVGILGSRESGSRARIEQERGPARARNGRFIMCPLTEPDTDGLTE